MYNHNNNMQLYPTYPVVRALLAPSQRIVKNSDFIIGYLI